MPELFRWQHYYLMARFWLREEMETATKFKTAQNCMTQAQEPGLRREQCSIPNYSVLCNNRGALRGDAPANRQLLRYQDEFPKLHRYTAQSSEALSALRLT